MDDDRVPSGATRVYGAAVAWGFAEATLFFLAPDVLLSFIVARSTRRALIATAFVVAGALLGGTIMYAWGSSDPVAAIAVVERVPMIPSRMVEGVDQRMSGHGVLAMVPGAFMGTPYKIYAVRSARHGIGLPLFLLVSIPSRLGRLVPVTLIVAGLFATVGKDWVMAKRMRALFVFWILFYAVMLWLLWD